MMENKESSEPPGKRKNGSLSDLFKKFFSKKDVRKLSPSQRDAFIEQSIEEFSSNISLETERLEEAAKEMIHGIVELSDTTVKEIMVPRVDIVGVEIGTPLRDLIELVKKAGHSRFPLFHESLDDIKGILYIKDLFVESLDAGDVILATKARPAFFVPENKIVSELLKELRQKKIHLAIVVDEYGGTAGLVTLEDILEEIVGEIEDEYDLETNIIKKLDDGHYSVKGSLPISELNEELDIYLPEDEFETVGGVIYDLVGSLPEQGTVVDYKGLKFTAAKVVGQRITRVHVDLTKHIAGQSDNVTD